MTPRRRTPSTDPSLAVGYIRVSTEDQHLGPEAQEAAIRNWAAQHQVQLVSIRTDKGVSGATPADQRDGFMAALADLEQHRAGHLVVAKFDRVARDLFVHAVAERLIQRTGASITPADGIGAGSGPEAGLLRGILQLLSEYERALIKARTSAALKAKRARGERAGEIPLGYADQGDGRLVPVPAEQEAIQLAQQLHREGQTLRAIGAALEARGYAPRGRGWHPQTVARMIQGPSTTCTTGRAR